MSNGPSKPLNCLRFVAGLNNGNRLQSRPRYRLVILLPKECIGLLYATIRFGKTCGIGSIPADTRPQPENKPQT